MWRTNKRLTISTLCKFVGSEGMCSSGMWLYVVGWMVPDVHPPGFNTHEEGNVRGPWTLSKQSIHTYPSHKTQSSITPLWQHQDTCFLLSCVPPSLLASSTVSIVSFPSISVVLPTEKERFIGQTVLLFPVTNINKIYAHDHAHVCHCIFV